LAPPIDPQELLAEAEAGRERVPPQPGIDISQVDGRVQASSINQINQIIARHPDETVAILRQWMYQDS